jgi:ribosomal protein S27AE
VQTVADWLSTGRIERAPDPPTGYTPHLPKACPVCGAGVIADHSLSGRTRGIGWQCVLGGATHYWQSKWESLRGWFFRDDVIPGVLKRHEVRDGLPMGYLPEANQCDSGAQS